MKEEKNLDGLRPAGSPRKERPILFSASMVRAILREIDKPGTGKTVTRRIIAKPNRFGILKDLSDVVEVSPSEAITEWWDLKAKDGLIGSIQCPYGQPGDRLWVRERMRVVHIVAPAGSVGIRVRYEADQTISDWILWPDRLKGEPETGKCLAYGGFREASRLTLEVTGVRVERLQDITEEDARAEGVGQLRADGRMENGLPASDGYAELWESINGPGSWDANPWVWAVQFQPAQRGEAIADPSNSSEVKNETP